jgi:hypothetical protein
VKYWTIPRDWEGETCVILGGGPSLEQVDFSLLSQSKVIAVNDAYKLAQWDLCYFKDDNWYYQNAFKDKPEVGTNGEHLRNFPGLKVTSCHSDFEDPDIHVMQRGRRDHLERDPNFITHACNAGAEATALAIMRGCNMIVLVGFDMKKINGKHNWHANHERDIPASIYKDYFMTPFRALAKDAKELGVSIINCTIGSALDTFPIVALGDVFNADGSLRDEEWRGF